MDKNINHTLLQNMSKNIKKNISENITKNKVDLWEKNKDNPLINSNKYNRINSLKKVFKIFSLNGEKKVGSKEIMILGQSMLKFKQKPEIWSKEQNDLLLRTIGLDENGNISEENFINHFNNAMPQNPDEFLKNINQFIECASVIKNTEQNIVKNTEQNIVKNTDILLTKKTNKILKKKCKEENSRRITHLLKLRDKLSEQIFKIDEELNSLIKEL